MAIRTLLLISWGILASCGTAQVESNAYDTMLQGLLSHSVNEVSVQEVISTKGDLILLDAREKEEFQVSHLQGAIHVGYEDFGIETLSGFDKEAPIVVYCSLGYRSEKIAEKLEEAGYINVSNLYGGIFEWMNKSYDVFNDNGRTDSVHAYDRTWGVWLNEGEKVYD